MQAGGVRVMHTAQVACGQWLNCHIWMTAVGTGDAFRSSFGTSALQDSGCPWRRRRKLFVVQSWGQSRCPLSTRMWSNGEAATAKST